MRLELASGLERQGLAVVDDPLGLGDGERRLLGDLGGGLVRALEELGPLDDEVDQADAQRLVGVDHVAGEDQLLGLGDADTADQPLGTAEARDHAQADLGLAELGAARGVDEVTRQRQLAAAAEGEAVDRRDPDLVRPFDRRHEPAPPSSAK